MANLPLKTTLDFPLVTAISGLLFMCAYFFKVGESVYFGYPSYYIYLDLTEVINLSLKMFAFMCGTIGVLHLIFDSSWKLNKHALWGIGISTVVAELTNIYLRIQEQDWDYVSYLDISFLMVAGLGMFYFFVRSFIGGDGRVHVIPSGLALSVFFMALFSFLSGVNYHRQIGSTLWKTADNKYVIGEYKDAFLMKQCVNGKGIFSIKEYKDSDFTEVNVAKDARRMLRCKS
ncbi:hypothetical protein [Pantoea agglomerans]|uniref:hypothetical protein n=1 Tax=Enterobacter agglomerans TaxID=549 RepID=UPI0010C1B7D5|nr:hypothetical protein [Pantoea agglomerans]TKK36393.1 hypothetical protein PagCFBP13532_08945 [Pantoea agglomerans]